jgi:hypothetical protein
VRRPAFDGRGAYRDVDDTGFEVDRTGSINTFAGNRFEFTDSTDLLRQIAGSFAYSDCCLRKTANWFAGVETSDTAAFDYAARAYAPAAEQEVIAAIREFVLSEHFRYRAQ